MIRLLLLAAPAVAVIVFLAGLDMSVPLLDHWWQLEWYARVADEGFHVQMLFEPHGEIHFPALARAVLAPLAFASGWRIELEAWLDVALVAATCALALRIARRSEPRLGRGLSIAGGALTSTLLFSPVLWWAWIWTVAFVHFAMDAAVVTCAWALAPGAAPLSRRRLALAFAACLLASWDRVEGLLTWWIFLPLLWVALAGGPSAGRRRVVVTGWVATAVLQAALYAWLLASHAGSVLAQAAPFALDPWEHAVVFANLLGAPVAGFLQALLPDVPDSRRYAVPGALVAIAWLALAVRFALPRHAHLRSQSLPWIGIGAFGLAFAAAIGLARVGTLGSGLITFAYVSTYATTSSLVVISLLWLVLLALVGEPGRSERALRGRRLAWLGVAMLAACLAASYAAIVPTALAERARWRGRERCFELAARLDFRNTCFVKRPPPERLATLARLGFRPPPRRDLRFDAAPRPSPGLLERAGPLDATGHLEVTGRLAPGSGGDGGATILLARAGRHSFFARGLSDGERFALSVPRYVLPAAGGPVEAWLYRAADGLLLRLEGRVSLPPRR